MRIKKNSFVYLLASLILLLASCNEHIVGEGETGSQIFIPVSNFTKISVENDIDVTVKYAASKKVEVSGFKNLLENVHISATSGILHIGMKEDYTYENMNLTAVVSVPSFTQILITHDGNVEIDSFSTYFTTLHFGLSGNGNLTSLHHLNTQTLTADLTGAGSVTLNGSCVNQHLTISGSGNWNGFNQYSSFSTITLSGSGKAEVNPKMELYGTISGSGNIYYKRYPVVTGNITGSGTIIDAN